MKPRHIIIVDGDKKLTIKKSIEFIENFLTMTMLYNYLSKPQPPEISGRCKKRKYYIGHGVCLLYKFIKKDTMCSSCDSEEIIDQLNYILSIESKGRFVAEFKKRRKNKRRVKKKNTR
jgi:hypothetical protein